MCSPPAVASGVVYVGVVGPDGAGDGPVVALNAATGSLLGRFRWVMRCLPPAVAGGVVYVGSENDKFYALNATTGTALWSFTTGNEVSSSPAVVGNVVYVGSGDGKVYALGATTGALV